ncbi:hypothetical protein V6Z11_D13G223700 [Gossypium hirsutum]
MRKPTREKIRFLKIEPFFFFFSLGFFSSLRSNFLGKMKEKESMELSANLSVFSLKTVTETKRRSFTNKHCTNFFF